MRFTVHSLVVLMALVANGFVAPAAKGQLPVTVNAFEQPIHVPYATREGLPAEGISRITLGLEGKPYVQSASGKEFVFDGGRWASATKEDRLFDPLPWYPSLASLADSPENVRDVAQYNDEIAVAAVDGLYIGDGTHWERALPKDGVERWAPFDVRGVAYDREGRLWFASPQGVGCRMGPDAWKLYTGADGVPFNDFTCMAAGSTGMWFGTTNGAIQFDEGRWSFRQGRRWLLDNHVLDIAIDQEGDAWLATPAGVSRIAHKPMTLAQKATFYEDEIERYHRRTRFGYVNPAELHAPGDRSTARPVYSDNDGFNTGLYLAAMSFAYAVTGEAQYRQYADNAFRALSFLSEVTQGGSHPAPAGFIARNVIPTTEPDPNAIYDLDYDLGRQERDALWKVVQPRLPVDASGEFYWKCDSSSDELDGHFFGYAVYFDRVCDTENKRDEVRAVVRRIIEHILTHDYSLVDHDGRPTRWAHFSPDDLNRNEAWVDERGLNSYSILTYLSIAHHVTGDAKYRDVYMELALDHGYGMNGMTQPKSVEGPDDPGHQPDDNMAFMNYYHLLRYETDPKLLSMYQYAMRKHWRYERYERNAFTNFIYGACAQGESRTDQWETVDLSPPLECFRDAADTLMRYPLDLVEWPMSNAHRTDLVAFGESKDGPPRRGGRVDGYAFPIDERHETYWDWDPWVLTSNANGTRLRPGFHYLLAYYLGWYHGFIEG